MEYNEHHEDMAQIPSGPYHPQVIEETREDLEGLVTVLKQDGVAVRRPQVTDHSKVFSSPGRLFLNECDSRRLRTTGERDIIAFDAVPAGPWFEAGP